MILRVLLAPLRWVFPQIPPPIPSDAWRQPFDDVEYVRILDPDIEVAETAWRGEGDESLALLAEEDAAHVAERGYDWGRNYT